MDQESERRRSPNPQWKLLVLSCCSTVTIAVALVSAQQRSPREEKTAAVEPGAAASHSDTSTGAPAENPDDRVPKSQAPQQRPELPGDIAEEVVRLEERIAEFRKAGLGGDEEALAEAIKRAEEVLAIRLEHLSGWINNKGEPVEWYEIGDARRAIESLRLIASLNPEQRTELQKANDLEAQEYELYQRRKYAEAARLRRTELDVRRRILGDKHPETLQSIGNMGHLLKAMGRLTQAAPYFSSAVGSKRFVLGDEHPDTLISINSMGMLLHAQGKLLEAEPYFREVLEGRRRVLGSDHAATLDSINNMGYLLQQQGMLAEAERYFLDALEGSRRTLGDDHPDTLISINNMGMLLQARGKLVEAERFLRNALQACGRVLGDDHPDTLTAINNMGGLLKAQGKLAEADPYHREALEGRRRVLGDDHPDTLSSIDNIGALLYAQGKLAEAEAYGREALEGQRRVLGNDHPSTLATINNMGVRLKAQGKLAEADPYYHEALERKRRVLGNGHPSTLTSVNNLGALFQSMGKLAEAEACYLEALEGQRRVLGNDHPSTLATINNMGFLLMARGKLAEAEPYYRQAMKGRRSVQGDDHPDTLQSVTNMGHLLESMGKLTEAEGYFRQALSVAQRLRTGVIGGERSRAVYAGKLGLSEIAARLASLLIETDRSTEAWSVTERGRGRALLDLLSRSEQDLMEQARTRAKEAQNVETPGRLEATLNKEREAQVKLTTAEALLAGTRKQRKHTDGRDDLGEDEKAARLVKLDQQINEQEKAFKSKRQALAEAGAKVNIELRGLFPDAQPMGIDQVRAELEPGELMLGYTWTNEAVLLLVAETTEARATRGGAGAGNEAAQGDSGVRGFILVEGKEEVQQLTELAERVRQHLAERPPGSPSTELEVAKRELLAALIPETVLREFQSRERIIILPDGPLHGISFEALELNDSTVKSGRHQQKSLLDVGPEFVYAPSATVYLNRRAQRLARAGREEAESRGAVSIVALGNPVFAREKPSEPRPPEHGVVILAVSEGANAAKANLRSGDIVVGYGGQEIPDFDALVGVLNAVAEQVKAGKRSGDDRIAVKYWRDGHVHETTLAPGKMGVRLDRGGSPKETLEYLAMRSRGEEEKVAEISALDQLRLYGGSLPKLPGTEREVLNIVQTIEDAGGSATVLLGKNAKIGKLEEAVPGKSFVHVATHGFAGSSERPYDAGLALTQPKTPTPDDIGFLTLDRLIGKWQGKLKKCELVVLSACDTQRGVKVGDSVMALPWGFMYAGAPTVVASLWKADDQATVLLMTRFYENLLGTRTATSNERDNRVTPMAKAAALREAKLWLRSLRGQELTEALMRGGLSDKTVTERPSNLSHPFYWAGFVLIGDPG